MSPVTASTQTDRLHQALFAPRHVALVGASSDPTKASSRPLEFLRSARYPVRISVVNRRGTPIDDTPVHRSLLDVEDVPDHVFIMTPAASVLETVQQCADLGVTVATILSGGFAEEGEAGSALQGEVEACARRGGVRLLGPNSLGLVNLRNSLRLTGNAVFADEELSMGGTFVASQSGSLIGALVSRGAAKGVGFSSVVSVGGEMDLGIGEICSLTLDDDDVTGYLLFLETIRHAEQLAEFARAAGERGKPVVAYKLGRSELGAQMAQSHTGALAGEDDVADAFLRAQGIARVHTLDGLLESMPLVRRLPAKGHRLSDDVAVVTTTGGGGAMLVDQLSLRGASVRQPSEKTYARLAERGIEVMPGPVIDLTLAGTRYDLMKTVLDVLLEAPEFGMVAAVVGSSARTRPDLAVAPIIDSASADRTLATFIVPEAPEATAQLRAAGIPTFVTPEACSDVIAAALQRRPPSAAARAWIAPEMPACPLDEAASYDVLERAGLRSAPHVVLATEDVNDEIRLPFDYPVAVKMLDAAVAHKSDLGGVALGIQSAEELRQTVRAMQRHLAGTSTPLKAVLVQQMTSAVAEFLIGYRVDREVGPIVVLAAGGVNAELYRDRSVRIAPVDAETAREMLDEVVASATIDGFRGAPRGDREALVAALCALSKLADDPAIAEAEVNPLLVHELGQGVTAVDAVVTRHQVRGLTP